MMDDQHGAYEAAYTHATEVAARIRKGEKRELDELDLAHYTLAMARRRGVQRMIHRGLLRRRRLTELLTPECLRPPNFEERVALQRAQETAWAKRKQQPAPRPLNSAPVNTTWRARPCVELDATADKWLFACEDGTPLVQSEDAARKRRVFMDSLELQQRAKRIQRHAPRLW